jgi:hypothetical protein
MWAKWSTLARPNLWELANITTSYKHTSVLCLTDSA